MKYKYICLLGVVFLFSACKKGENDPLPLSTLNVINAMVDAGPIKVNHFGKPISWKNYTSGTANVAFGGVQVYSVNPGNNIHIVQSADSTKTLFNEKVTNSDRDMYSLYLTGTLTAPEVVVKKDDLPPLYTDMSIGIRVINLSPNSTPINVTLSSTPTVNEFNGVAYKSLTEIKKLPYPKPIVAGSNIFQIRDSAGNLLASQTLPTDGVLSIATARHRVVTLVIRGVQGITSGSNAFGCSIIKNF